MSEILNRKHGASVDVINARYTTPDKKKPSPLYRVVHEGEAAQIYTHHLPRFEQHTISEPAWDCLMVYVFANHIDADITTENYGNLLQRLCWLHTDILPQNHLSRKLHPNLSTVTFGENPNEEINDIFGQAVPIVKVEFLGHPDVLIAHLMEEQKNDFTPEILAQYAVADSIHKGNTWKREVLATSPVGHTSIKNILYNPGKKSKESFTYEGEVMTFIEMNELSYQVEDKHELVHHWQPSSLRIGLGIIADKDNKLRIYHTKWQDISSHKKHQKSHTLLQLLDGFYDLTQRCEREIDITEITNWEPRALDSDQIEFLTPDANRLRPEISRQKKTHTKPVEKVKKKNPQK